MYRSIVASSALGALTLAASLVGCGNAASPHAMSPAAATTSVAATPVSKVMVVVVENHSMAQMESGLPYLYRQAQRFGYTTDYHAIRHPSLPNYVAIATGSTHGITDDNPPSVNGFSGASVFNEALSHGRTAKVYAESMPRNCALSNAGRYAVRHNAWAYVRNQRTACGKYDVPMAPSLARDVSSGRLPNVGELIPNTCNDAHDCPLSTANSWLRNKISQLESGPDWSTGSLAIVVTADEDDDHSGNRVLTVVMRRGMAHRVVGHWLSHYSLSHSLSQAAGGGALTPSAATEPSLLATFGLSVH